MITEALVQLDEEFVSIECVKGEEAIVESLLPASLQEYKPVHKMYKNRQSSTSRSTMCH